MDAFSAIADPVRRNILTLLAHQPAPAGLVADAFGDISRPAVSRHLRVLREAGLVTAEASGRERIYSTSIAPLAEVIGWVDSLAPRFLGHLDALETEVFEHGENEPPAGLPSTHAKLQPKLKPRRSKPHE